MASNLQNVAKQPFDQQTVGSRKASGQKASGKKVSGTMWVSQIVICALFGVFTLICIYPLYYLIINTISANNLSANGDIMWFPRDIQLSNYVQVFHIPGLLNAVLVSIARTVLGTVGTVLGSAFLGFMFTQQKMWKRRLWYRATVITMYFNAGLIPWYITMYNLGLTNNFLAYILPAIVQPFNIILVKTFMESSIPASMQEAAEIDGAGILRTFWSIILPLSKPILATIAIFAAVGQWNSFQDTLVLVTNPRLYTLQFILYQYMNQANSIAAMLKNNEGLSSAIGSLATMPTPLSIQMTVAVIAILPIMLVYPFFQRYFVKGVMIGAVKG